MKRFIPDTITLMNLLSGCMAIYCAFHPLESYSGHPGYMLSFCFIMLAAVADFCDGLSARLLHASSGLGKQLDSLSDLVSFGVAPAMILLNLFEAAGAPRWLCLLCLLVPVCGALRLARFNIDDSQATTFRGLPIPAAALFCIGLASIVAAPGGVNLPAAAGCITAIALLMVAPVDMYSLKFKSPALKGNIMRYLLVVIAVACICLWHWAGLFYLVAYYVLSSFIVYLYNSCRHAPANSQE